MVYFNAKEQQSTQSSFRLFKLFMLSQVEELLKASLSPTENSLLFFLNHLTVHHTPFESQSQWLLHTPPTPKILLKLQSFSKISLRLQWRPPSVHSFLHCWCPSTSSWGSYRHCSHPWTLWSQLKAAASAIKPLTVVFLNPMVPTIIMQETFSRCGSWRFCWQKPIAVIPSWPSLQVSLHWVFTTCKFLSERSTTFYN